MSSKVHKFNVEMTCGGCSGAVENVLKKLGNAIEKVEINLDDKTVAVTTSLDYERVLEQIKKTGKETVYLVSE